MDKHKKYKIALVLYTQGIDYDDRIRKEMLSIKGMYTNVEFKIFAVEPKNREESGVCSYGVRYRIPYLRTRDKYPSGTHTLQKAWDFYKTIQNDLKEYDAVWCADPETFIFVLMIHGKPIVWDLHELPLAFMGNPIMRLLFKYLERRCKVMIHANEPRLKYLVQLGMVKQPEKQFVLRNYPQFNEIDEEYDALYYDFLKWLGDDKCVYLQGIVSESRADVESIQAVMAMPNLKAVVVGSIKKERMEVFKQLFGENVLKERVFFTGRVKQLKTPQYIKKCCVALIFYKNTSPNNWYCEPNRLFQNIINGNPVVVGNNPPMKDLVESNHFGVCVDTDGTDTKKIAAGLKYVIDNMNEYRNFNVNELMWGSQDDTISKFMACLMASS